MKKFLSNEKAPVLLIVTGALIFWIGFTAGNSPLASSGDALQRLNITLDGAADASVSLLSAELNPRGVPYNLTRLVEYVNGCQAGVRMKRDLNFVERDMLLDFFDDLEELVYKAKLYKADGISTDETIVEIENIYTLYLYALNGSESPMEDLLARIEANER